MPHYNHGLFEPRPQALGLTRLLIAASDLNSWENWERGYPYVFCFLLVSFVLLASVFTRYRRGLVVRQQWWIKEH